MAEADMVSGDGCFSDDSSFYGDDDEQEHYLSLCDALDYKTYWTTRAMDLNVALNASQSNRPVLHNIYEGQLAARQLNESVDHFLQRLPPLTTTLATVGPWLWAANPFPESRDLCCTNVADLVSRGSELLERFLEKRDSTLKQKIECLAAETNVLAGKWMLFPQSEDLARFWRLIVEGTIQNRLGTVAKVATDKGDPRPRLICVYTKDFRDEQDVFRVLKELAMLGLVGNGRDIYYKSDAYTYLDIYGKNAYGLQASIYSSQKMLAATNAGQMESSPRKNQTAVTAPCCGNDAMDMDID